PGAVEVLVGVGAAGIRGSDVEVLEGRRPAPYVRYPIIPGHEWAGTVEAVGPGVENIDVGAAVVAEGFRACGDCARCREGLTNLCEVDYAETGFTHAGAFADFVCVPAQLVHQLPKGSDLAAAALLEPAACVAQGLLEVDLRPGLSVAVVGSGTLGLLAVALLRRVSPRRLALVGTRPPRLALGVAIGATETWNVREGEHPEPGFFDLVFEAAGTPDAARSAVALARRGGTGVRAGRPPPSVALAWLGQSSVALRLGAATVLVDPFLSPHPDRLVPPPFSAEEARGVDVVLITHDHLDHLDEDALPAIAVASPSAI